MKLSIETDQGDQVTLTTEHAAPAGTCAEQVRRLIAEGDVIGRLRVFAGG